MEQRVIDLEIRLSHQELSLEELVHTVLEQQKALARLEEELRYVKSLLREVSSGVVGPQQEEGPPPHY